MAITRFDGEHHFLSNFYKSDVDFEGMIYPTVEHGFQAAKTSNMDDRKKIQTSGNPAVAKTLGRNVDLRSDWEEVKDEIMTDLIRQKFQDEKCKKLLLATGDKDLIEENKWHDNYWGNCLCDKCSDKIGKNHLGLILQKIRLELMVA